MVKSSRMGFLVGFALCFALVACAGFKYRYYSLDLEVWSGTLQGNEPKNDLPFSVCEPTAIDRNPCVVMLRDDFFRMKERYLAMERQLLK